MDDDALQGALDAAKPWTIKSVGTGTRDRAIAAARREGITVGQWLDRRMREWEAQAGQPAVSLSPPSQADTVGPAKSQSDLRDTPSRGTLDLAGIAEMTRAAALLSGLTEEQRRDPLSRTARATVRAALLVLRPQRAPAPAGSAALRIGSGQAALKPEA